MRINPSARAIGLLCCSLFFTAAAATASAQKPVSPEGSGAFATGHYRNLFREAGHSQVQIDAKDVRDRTLRNHIGAHVDVDQTLSSLIAAIESYDWLRLANAVAFSKQSFRQACEAGPLYLRLLARHKAPLRGITIGESPDAPSYDHAAP